MSKHVWEKCGKLCISSFLSSKRDITPTKIDTNQQHSILICKCIKIKSYTKFQLNMSKHVGEKCGKLWRMDGRTSPYHNKSRLKLTTKFSRQYRYLSLTVLHLCIKSESCMLKTTQVIVPWLAWGPRGLKELVFGIPMHIVEDDWNWVWLLHYGTVDFIVGITLRKRRGPSFLE